MTNHSFWEEEAFRCLYYAEKTAPISHLRDSATLQLRIRYKLQTMSVMCDLHICIDDCQSQRMTEDARQVLPAMLHHISAQF